MIPVLFNPTDYIFNNFGIGHLIDVISCEVTEERNGPLN
jgi:phage-related protein